MLAKTASGFGEDLGLDPMRCCQNIRQGCEERPAGIDFCACLKCTRFEVTCGGVVSLQPCVSRPNPLQSTNANVNIMSNEFKTNASVAQLDCAIWWVRRDLRLDDNPALQAVLKEARTVVGP